MITLTDDQIAERIVSLTREMPYAYSPGSTEEKKRRHLELRRKVLDREWRKRNPDKYPPYVGDVHPCATAAGFSMELRPDGQKPVISYLSFGVSTAVPMCLTL